MSYKYFTTRYSDPETQIKSLRSEFPGMQFLKGVLKDKKGVFVLNDLTTKEYGDKIQLENGDFFFPPTESNLDSIKKSLDKYKTKYEERITITLVSGLKLEIFPASAIPQKVLFSKRFKNVAEGPYNTDNPYGKRAYELYFKASKDVEIKYDDPEFYDFICMALKESYRLPVEMWDHIGLSLNDLDKVFGAACGIDFEALSKTS